jgi:hypothetical protein
VVCLHKPASSLAFIGLRRLALPVGCPTVKIWTDAIPQRNCGRFSRPSPLPGMMGKEQRTLHECLYRPLLSSRIFQPTKSALRTVLDILRLIYSETKINEVAKL